MWIALIVVVVLLIVWIIGVYNNLVSLKMRVKNAQILLKLLKVTLLMSKEL